MNTIRHAALALALAATACAAGCGRGPDASRGDAAAAAEEAHAATVIGRRVEREIEKARAEIRTKDLQLGREGNGIGVTVNGKRFIGKGPGKAAITPQGDFVVDGKAVAVTPEQRKLLLEYRGQLVGVAEAGMVIGAKGADIATAALSQALGSLFGNGDTREIKKRAKAQAKALKQEAKAICAQLPAILATEGRLAASLPEFKPYANLTQEDVDECGRDLDDDDDWDLDDDDN